MPSSPPPPAKSSALRRAWHITTRITANDFLASLMAAFALWALPTYVIPAFQKITGSPMMGTVSGVLTIVGFAFCMYVWMRHVQKWHAANVAIAEAKRHPGQFLNVRLHV